MAAYTHVSRWEGEEPEKKVYVYRQQAWKLAPAVVFFPSGAALFGHLARHNHRGVIIDGFIRLGPAAASIFYWFLCILCAGIALLAVAIFVRTHIAQPAIVSLSATAITIPPYPASYDTVCIQFSSIRRLEKVTSRRGRYEYYNIYFSSWDGVQQKVPLMSSCLPSGAILEILSAIEGRSPALQAAEQV